MKIIAAVSSIMLFCMLNAQNAIAITFNFNSPIIKTDEKAILSDFLEWILGLAGSIALLALIIAGIMYMTSTGNPNKAKKAKGFVLVIIGGLILILLSYSILILIKTIFT